MEFPKMFVKLERDGYCPRIARVHVRERTVGSSIYKYLSWRDGVKVKELYMGKITLHDPRPVSVAKKSLSRKASCAGRRRSAAECRATKGEIKQC